MLPAVDAAVVVCEADEKKIPQLQLILRELEDQNIPRFLFLNKIDKADTARARDAQAAAAGLARAAAAAADSDLERRHHFRLRRSRAGARLCLQGARAVRGRRRSKATTLDREKEARFSMLETLADHDDELMEQLLEDIQPPRDKVFDDLAKELRDGLVVPGADRRRPRAPTACCACSRRCATRRPASPKPRKRLGVKAGNDAVALVLKTLHTAHGGKMSVARVLAGQVGDGTTFNTPEREAGRVSGVFKLMGQHHREARAGGAPAKRSRFGKLDHAKTGDTLSTGKQAHAALVEVEALSAGAGDRGVGQGAQGRRQARPGASPSWPRRIPRSPSCTTPKRTRW